MKTRSAIVNLARSWIGKNEADGSYKTIIDIYNTHRPYVRGVKMEYDWEWCACTWSALAIKLGYTDIIPLEISCSKLIELAKEMGIWQEADDYIPAPGDAVLYDWQDSGIGDNKNGPDHIGIVEEVKNGIITVIEGNYSNSVKRRQLEVNGKYIRGFICPRYDAEPTTATTSKYTLKQFIKDVQKACGADVDGVAGPETIGKTVTLSRYRNRTHAAVVAVQKRLYALGYTQVGTADGVAGPKFEAAVKAFQKDNSCTVDGEITANNKTWRKLLGMK